MTTRPRDFTGKTIFVRRGKYLDVIPAIGTRSSGQRSPIKMPPKICKKIFVVPSVSRNTLKPASAIICAKKIIMLFMPIKRIK